MNDRFGREREKQAHLWIRDPDDWYVEPYECSRALFNEVEFSGPIWDPACGMGRIIETAQEVGLHAVGTDLVARNEICLRELDFLDSGLLDGVRDIVTNPPFKLAEEFVRRAISIVPNGGKVAAILPIVWLSGFSTKRDWLPRSPLKLVLPISPRPSMPPGRVIEAGVKPGNGTKDFAWLVWESGFQGRPSVNFLNTNSVFRGRKEDRLI